MEAGLVVVFIVAVKLDPFVVVTGLDMGVDIVHIVDVDFAVVAHAGGCDRPDNNVIHRIGVFSAGGSSLKLGGAPIVIKGKKIASKGALLVKMAGQMKMG